MASISTTDFKNGITIDIDGQLFGFIEFQHVNPGKGAAFVRTKLRNVKTGAVLERTFRAGERLEQAIVESREMQVLYRDGDDFVFMDTGTYDQVTIPGEATGSSRAYLRAGDAATVRFHEDTVVGVQLPASVTLKIVQTDPGVQGDRVSGATKPATLETGKSILVPLFVVVGDDIVVDTRTGEYLSRA